MKIEDVKVGMKVRGNVDRTDEYSGIVTKVEESLVWIKMQTGEWVGEELWSNASGIEPVNEIQEEIPKGCLHAECMKQYAEDASVNEKPWELWEHQPLEYDFYIPMNFHPQWLLESKYRRKPKAITCNAFQVPAPESAELIEGSEYYLADPNHESFTMSWRWYARECDFRALTRGLVHLKKENAVMHAKAMLGIDPSK